MPVCGIGRLFLFSQFVLKCLTCLSSGFFMLVLVADCSFLDDGYFVFEWNVGVNFDFFL